MVLSLLGTVGSNPEWNDRLNSKQHIGIPFVSFEFLRSIPMISQLLKDLDFDLEWVENMKQVVTGKSGAASCCSGMFYVRDAAIATDEQQRKIISAQDFVNDYQIKTVFGFGGKYSEKMLMTAIFFTAETIEKDVVDRFFPLASFFKSTTMNLALNNDIFTSSKVN